MGRRKRTLVVEYPQVTFELIQEACLCMGVKGAGFFRLQSAEYGRAYRICYEASRCCRCHLYLPAKLKVIECFRKVRGRLMRLLGLAADLESREILEGYRLITGARNNAISEAMGYSRGYLCKISQGARLKEEMILFISRVIQKLSHTIRVL